MNSEQNATEEKSPYEAEIVKKYEGLIIQEPVMNGKQVAEMLQISDRFVRELANRGKIPSFKIGSRILFKRVEILAWLENQ